MVLYHSVTLPHRLNMEPIIEKEDTTPCLCKDFHKDLADPKIGKLKKGYPVEVKSAGIKGNGVFATRDIEIGEILCYYDGFVCQCPNIALLISGDYNYGQNYDEVTSYNAESLRKTIAGFPEYLRDGGCAQLCNDASTTYTDETDLKYLKNINVQEEPSGNTLVFCASKRIKKGQEILYSYGPQYWTGKKNREEVMGQVDGYDPREFPKLFASFAADTVISQNNRDNLGKMYADSFKLEGWCKWQQRYTAVWLLHTSQGDR